jgi:hypothetical protein
VLFREKNNGKKIPFSVLIEGTSPNLDGKEIVKSESYYLENISYIDNNGS